MRRLTPLVISIAVVFAACGGSDDAEPSADSAVDSTPATEPAVTEPAATDPPATDPPATDPPVTDPPATDPPVTDPPATDPPVTESPAPELEAFTPIGDGPYAVGVQTITITDVERDRPLTVDVTFPLAEGATGDPQQYTFITGDYYESPNAIAASADQISPDGPFPLIVYTHGSGGSRYIHSNYNESLASHGYLVIAADHTGNTAVDQFLDQQDDRATIAYNRPRDVQVMIDEMLNPESVETVGFVASVNPDQIAVTGHSLGGYGTYAVASGMSNEAGTLEPDDRIDALIPLAPALGNGDPETSLLTDEQLAAVDVPTLVMVGTDDKSTPPSPNVDRAFEFTQSSPLYRVDLVAAEHQSFTDVCDYLDFFPTLENPTQAVLEVIEESAEAGCSEGDMPIERVKEITNTFAVSFLDSIFKGGEMITDANTALPDDVIFASK